MISLEELGQQMSELIDKIIKNAGIENRKTFFSESDSKCAQISMACKGKRALSKKILALLKNKSTAELFAQLEQVESKHRAYIELNNNKRKFNTNGTKQLIVNSLQEMALYPSEALKYKSEADAELKIPIMCILLTLHLLVSRADKASEYPLLAQFSRDLLNSEIKENFPEFFKMKVQSVHHSIFHISKQHLIEAYDMFLTNKDLVFDFTQLPSLPLVWDVPITSGPIRQRQPLYVYFMDEWLEFGFQLT